MGAKKTGEAAISDEAVGAKTGRPWKAWFALLDRWGAGDKGHKATARHLATRHDVSAWWSQAITVRYEQERGLRKVGERADRTFEVAVQRTVPVSRTRAFEAFADPEAFGAWYGRPPWGEPARSLRGKSLRFVWRGPARCPGSAVEVTFESRGRGRSAVRVTHKRLRTEKDRESMKKHWGAKMDAFKASLEG